MMTDLGLERVKAALGPELEWQALDPRDEVRSTTTGSVIEGLKFAFDRSLPDVTVASVRCEATGEWYRLRPADWAVCCPRYGDVFRFHLEISAT